MITREGISKAIQSNQKVNDSTRAWAERLADVMFLEIEQLKEDRKKLSDYSESLENECENYNVDISHIVKE